MPVPPPAPDSLLPIRQVGAPEDGAPASPFLLVHRVHQPQSPARPPQPAAPCLIWPAAPVTEQWWSPRPATVAQDLDGAAALHWACDGDWLFARITVDETATPDGLIGAARIAYTRLFGLMARHGLTQPARFWNYLADINAETDSPAGRLERYRQFNIGRQQAFVAAGQAAFDGAPAACALGTEAGALSVALLAGRIDPRVIENPRQVSAYRYPNDHGPVSPTFSRAAELRLSERRSLLFISGTASIVGHQSVHPGDVAEQTRESLRNIDVLLAQVEGEPNTLRRALDLTVYLRHADDLASVRAVLAAWLRHDVAALDRTVWLRADVCRAELLVEIEAQAVLNPSC
ncbi:Rid family hydrolase [Sphaerotilus mobilis]|uniref:Enamine deaminase RidA (YjgF/YER057c/UK114 family) n=1 Tax=Sphaerotilus mobilis TaxID=47994 RepID=A0A4Q7LC00_9BURK|nr:Rid family hydrolase [Sphaerotilus mobilis]RZS51896.1 enamine deaminase RidA (YjgF/YER057c/UK114 family) [Sphaerotilus mobilis]